MNVQKHDLRNNHILLKILISLRKSMNEWCFKARRQLRSFWALNNFLNEIIKHDVCDTLNIYKITC